VWNVLKATLPLHRQTIVNSSNSSISVVSPLKEGSYQARYLNPGFEDFEEDQDNAQDG
jgi:hypothetical protein